MRPVGATIAEGEHIRLVVEMVGKQDVLDLAADVNKDLSNDEISDIEQIAQDRRNYFCGAGT